MKKYATTKSKHCLKIVSFLILFTSFNTKAQDTLSVFANNHTSFPELYYNAIYLNQELLSYGVGVGTPTPAFLVMVFDTNCDVWDSLPFTTTINNPQSPVAYFKFDQNDLVHLNDLDSLINNFLPDDHPFILYTVLGYDGPAVEAIAPQLGQTFTNYWGSDAIEATSTMILFGIKGHPSSFEIDTLVTGNELEFTTTICPHTSQTASLDETKSNHLLAKPNPSGSSMTIEFQNNYEYLEITDLSGRIVRNLYISSKQVVIDGLPDGQYLLSGVIGTQRSEPIRIQFY